MDENNKMYETILKEFALKDDNIEKIKEDIEELIEARKNICKALKISEANSETIANYENELIKNIDSYKENIKHYSSKKVEIEEKIKITKQEIHNIKPYIKKLEEEIASEKQLGKKLYEAMHIFLSREKLKSIKKLITKKYRKVFLKYSSETIIVNEINECKKRKEKIREEKHNLIEKLEALDRKDNDYKRTLGQTKKNIIHTEKYIDFLNIKLEYLKNYKEREEELRRKIWTLCQ